MSTEISPRQKEYMLNLLSERLATLQCATVEEAAEKLHLDQLSKKDASTVIDRLRSMPVDPDPSLPAVVAAAPRHGVNGSPGPCSSCKNTVQAGEGFYYGERGAWHVHHKLGACGMAKLTADLPPAEVVEGIYLHDDGRVSKLYMTGNQRLGGKALTSSGRYVYQQGLVMIVRQAVADGTAHLMTADEASAFGATHSYCVNCGEELTDPRSDPKKGGVGYGPVCAKRHGWPWGAVKALS